MLGRRVLAVLLAVFVGVSAGCSAPNPLKPGTDNGGGSGAGTAVPVVTTTTVIGGATVTTTVQDLTPKAPFERFGTMSVRITLPDGTTREWCLLLADTDELRGRGLMEVTDLAGYQGMAFSWGGREIQSAFYMFQTKLPLSIAYFAADGRFLGSNDMPPCPETDASKCPVYFPPAAYTLAVEVPLGGLDELGIVPGSTLADLGAGCLPV